MDVKKLSKLPKIETLISYDLETSDLVAKYLQQILSLQRVCSKEVIVNSSSEEVVSFIHTLLNNSYELSRKLQIALDTLKHPGVAHGVRLKEEFDSIQSKLGDLQSGLKELGKQNT